MLSQQLTWNSPWEETVFWGKNLGTLGCKVRLWWHKYLAAKWQKKWLRYSAWENKRKFVLFFEENRRKSDRRPKIPDKLYKAEAWYNRYKDPGGERSDRTRIIHTQLEELEVVCVAVKWEPSTLSLILQQWLLPCECFPWGRGALGTEKGWVLYLGVSKTGILVLGNKMIYNLKHFKRGISPQSEVTILNVRP